MRPAAIRSLVLVLLIALTGAASAQTRCTTLHFQHTTLCTFPDGSGLETTYLNRTWTDTEYAPADWAARYIKLTKLDTEYLQSATAIRAKYTIAGAIQAKKPCAAAGFYWTHGVCSVEVVK